MGREPLPERKDSNSNSSDHDGGRNEKNKVRQQSKFGRILYSSKFNKSE